MFKKRIDSNDEEPVVNTKPVVPVGDKYMLSLVEASKYFNIGVNKLRRIAEDNLGKLSVLAGNRYLINRKNFEKFLDQTTTF